MPSIINATTTNGVAISPDNSGSLQLQTNNGTTAVTIDTSQNVGIGTSSPTQKLSILGGASAAGYISLRGNNNASSSEFLLGQAHDGTTAYAFNRANGVLVFGTNNTERMRITSGGDVIVGKTVTTDSVVGGVLFANGKITGTMAASTSSTSTLEVYSTGASAYRFYVTMDGKIACTSTTIAAISDQRLKENIQDIDVGLDAIMTLKPRKFDWKTGKGKNIKGDRGWIAQEFEQVFPDMISNWKDEPPEGEEPYKAVAADLIPVLVKAIQELKAELDATKAEVQALKGVK